MRAVALDFEQRRRRSAKSPRRDHTGRPGPISPGRSGRVRDRSGTRGVPYRLSSPWRIPSGDWPRSSGTGRAGGAAVKSFRPGDWVVPMIRRGCVPPCRSCARRRSDLCTTGAYGDRGIMGMHGYFCELAVDSERDLVGVPPLLAEFAVLAEPLSVVEKAIRTAAGFREEPAETALVLGAGPVGLLAALALRLRGLDVRSALARAARSSAREAGRTHRSGVSARAGTCPARISSWRPRARRRPVLPPFAAWPRWGFARCLAPATETADSHFEIWCSAIASCSAASMPAGTRSRWQSKICGDRIRMFCAASSSAGPLRIFREASPIRPRGRPR